MRPRILILTLCVLLTPLWLPHGHAEPDSGWRLEERVPASTLALLTLEDLGSWESRVQQTAIGKLFDEPEMRAFWAPLQAELEAMAEDPSGPLAEVPFAADVARQLAGLDGQVAIALLDVDMGGDVPTMVASLDFGPRLPEFVTFVNRLKADLGEDGEAIQTFERDGRTWWQVDTGGPVVSATTVDTAFVLGTDPEVVSDVISGPQASSLASTKAFQSARARTGGDALGLFLYMNVPQLVEKFGDEMDGQSQAIANALGLDTITASAYGMAFKGDGFLDTFVIETPEAEHGLTTHELFEPMRQEALEMVPANAFYYGESSLRFDQLMPTVRTILAEVDEDMLEEVDEVMEHVRAEIGVDLEKELPPLLANQSAFYAALPEGGGLFPEMAMLFKVKDRAAIEPFMKRVMDGVAGSLTESGEAIASPRTIDYHGHTLHLFEMQGAERDDFVPMTPSWAIVGDWLVITMVPYTLKDIILRREMEGDAFKSLAGEEDFQSVMKHKPANAGVVYYLDSQAIMALLYDTTVPLLQAAVKPNLIPVPVKIDWAQLPPARAVRKHFRSFGYFVTWDRSGLSVSTHGPLPYMSVTAVSALGAAAFAVGSTRARREMPMPMNIRQVAGKQVLARAQAQDVMRFVRLFELEKGRLPGSLQELVDDDVMPELQQDPWGNTFELVFVDDGFRIVSPGPDGIKETQDDVVVLSD